MRLSKYFFHTVKESPSDAEIESHRLLIRGGFIKKVAPGIYSLLPLGLRAIRKFENIVREEMNRSGAIEILMPMVQPRELWEETNRWEIMGKGLLKMKDRNDHDMCLGATHEEVVTDIARREVKSYRDLPVNLYQIQSKYRDEIRARFGLMRGKEFIMKDAYSFDVSKEAALKSYEVMYQTYKRIFSRCGLKFRTVRADSGAIGGSQTHEFQVLAQSGEDLIMACDKCEYASNIEITPAIENGALSKPSGGKKEKFATPGLKTIDDLAQSTKTDAHNLAKTLFYKFTYPDPKPGTPATHQYICVMLRGDEELNEIKLKNIFGLSMNPEMCNEQEVLSLTGAHPGSCGPIGLKVPVVPGLKIANKVLVICDEGLKTLSDWTTGANEDDFHVRNVNPDVDFKVDKWVDIRKAKAGDPCPDCSGKLEAHRGIEVGHVFYLGDKYSKAMKATFLDPNGKAQFCEMGCYGIGIGRTVQSAIEQSHDKDGMIWPMALAPFQVLICLLDVGDAETTAVADGLYKELLNKNIEVLFDDRDERPGSKFKDADLIGIPLRINVGKRSLSEGGQIEIIERKSKQTLKLKPSEATDYIVKNVLSALEVTSK